MMFIVGTCIALAQADYGAEDGGYAGQDSGYTQDAGYGTAPGYAEQSDYQAQPTAAYPEPTPPTYITTVERPGTCGCNRHSPCFDRKANKCVKAICDGYDARTFAVKKGSAAPSFKMINDPNDPNTIIIGVDTLAMGVVDDDEPTGGVGDVPLSGNDAATNPYSKVAYGDSYYETVCLPCRCPAHTHRCDDFNQLRKWGTIVVILEFILLLIFATLFTYEAWIRTAETRMWYAVAASVNVIATCAVLIVMLDGGYYVRCWDQRNFYWIRYVEWMLTAPQVLWVIQAVARGGGPETREHPFGVRQPGKPLNFIIDANLVLLMVASVMMIASGMIGSFIEDGTKWAFFAFGILCFIPIFSIVYGTVPPGNTALAYQLMSRLILFTWSMYPILWFFDEGLGLVSIDVEAIIFFLLSLLGKIVFGALVVFIPWQN